MGRNDCNNPLITLIEQILLCSVSVEDEGDTLEDPMTDVSVGLDVSDKDFALAHGVLSVLSHVNGRLDRATKLELVGFDGDNAD